MSAGGVPVVRSFVEPDPSTTPLGVGATMTGLVGGTVCCVGASEVGGATAAGFVPLIGLVGLAALGCGGTGVGVVAVNCAMA